MKINTNGIILTLGYYVVTRAISDVVFNMPQVDYLTVLSFGIVGGFIGSKLMFK